MFQTNQAAAELKNGVRVRIRRTIHSPYAGRSGVLAAIEPCDPYGAYLVQFEDGLQFRYGVHELELLAHAHHYFYERPIRVLLELRRSLRA